MDRGVERRLSGIIEFDSFQCSVAKCEPRRFYTPLLVVAVSQRWLMTACADSAFGSERIAQETDASRSGLRKFLLGQNLENQRSEMRDKEAAVIFIRTLKG